MITAIAYIHGFNSSPASFKATLLRAEITRRAPQAVFIAPQLPHSPAAAAGLLENLARTHPRMVLVGSSLGGYYATWLAEKFALRAVLLNPAVRPYELLAGHIGRQKNLHTGEEYEFTAQHVAQRIIDTLAAPMRLGSQSRRLSVSIGVAAYPRDADLAEELVDKADWAMYLGKRRGRNRVVVFGPGEVDAGPSAS